MAKVNVKEWTDDDVIRWFIAHIGMYNDLKDHTLGLINMDERVLIYSTYLFKRVANLLGIEYVVKEIEEPSTSLKYELRFMYEGLTIVTYAYKMDEENNE